MRITLAQLNPTVGDVAGNTRQVLEAIDEATQAGADLLVCPEMMLLGYPPRDLLFREGVVEAAESAVQAIANAAGDLTVIVGHPRRDRAMVRTIRNSASVCRDGDVIAVYDKRLLPGYDIFDEDRYFDPGESNCIVAVAGRKIGVLICEDLWRAGDVAVDRDYPIDPAGELADAGCDVLVSPNATPFIAGKYARHMDILKQTAMRVGRPIVAVNQVGGNDDLVFDGRSAAVGADGSVLCALPGWTRAVETFDLNGAGETVEPEVIPERELFHALRIGVRDYCRKTGHTQVVIGLSGGIDSALTAAIAAAALGPENVIGITLPSRYSSAGSVDDSQALADAMGIGRFERIEIEQAHQAIKQAVAPGLGDSADGLTDENVQARVRGVIVMAYSNATGALVLATGNKSELAVGYATLYGDMCGALAVLGDVVKTKVYALSRWINDNYEACGFDRPPIPVSTIEKPPSAELRPDQVDEDSLPPYDVLDAIIERFVELEQSVETIIGETDFDGDMVRKFTRMIDFAEYKRNQAAVVLKVTQRCFGRGRAMPIVMRTTTL
jgi:NAD+ synthase (glutamine-hydrolysing)